jgi:hypothetical protein
VTHLIASMDSPRFKVEPKFRDGQCFGMETKIDSLVVSTVQIWEDEFTEIINRIFCIVEKFETMVFPIVNGEVKYADVYCMRYNFIEDALRGHITACELVESGEITYDVDDRLDDIRSDKDDFDGSEFDMPESY